MMTRHTLQLFAGPLHAEVSEQPHLVRIEITGARPMGCERAKLQRFLWPIVDAYRDDSRAMRIACARHPLVGHVVPTGGGAWEVYETERPT